MTILRFKGGDVYGIILSTDQKETLFILLWFDSMLIISIKSRINKDSMIQGQNHCFGLFLTQYFIIDLKHFLLEFLVIFSVNVFIVYVSLPYNVISKDFDMASHG